MAASGRKAYCSVASTIGKTLDAGPEPALAAMDFGLAGRPQARRVERGACFHCGEPCPDDTFRHAEKIFCCQGCLVVHDLLAENGLGQFYALSRHPGVRVRPAPRREEWRYLDDPAIQQALLDFTDGKISRVTFHVPAIHCVACVWLLENLFRLHAGIGRSEVNFPRREVSITYAAQTTALSEVVALLCSIGYAPRLTLGELEKRAADPARRRQWLQIGIAGFAFGNIMLFSLPLYLGLDVFTGKVFQAVFGYLSLGLALPALLYSASGYWRSALLSLRQKMLTLDVPIALGFAALYAQSAYEILSARGPGYLDSLAGLIFFLLCGRAFQQKTYERLEFDRDYRCFFPLSIRRKSADGEQTVALADLRVGDHLFLRNGDLVPADSRLVSGPACIDYSFVTGESEPVVRQGGDRLYAGGQQVGGGIEIETVKPVSQSYLISLWNHAAFKKETRSDLNTLTNRYSRRFTRLVVGVAIGAGLAWVLAGQAARGVHAFVSVLIVACPCALALAAPFTLGTAQRLLARLQVFLKDALILERMARVSAIVFDKTGTLTHCRGRRTVFLPAAASGGALPLGRREAQWTYSLARQSSHPHSRQIADFLALDGAAALAVGAYTEASGEGIGGAVEGHEIRLGSRRWLERAGVPVEDRWAPGSLSFLAIDGQCRGVFELIHPLRPATDQLLRKLAGRYSLALLSGDNEKERERFRGLFGPEARLQFNQSPMEKLEFIRQLQACGQTVLMVGDGLNDAGALKQSDIGVAVVERVGAFSPASDVILEAGQVPRLYEILQLARRSVRIVRWSFAISAVYNLAGVSIAAAGVLSPLICAVLMPLSSVSVVLFACGAVNWAAHREQLRVPNSAPQPL